MYNPRKTGNNNTKQKIRNTYPPLRKPLILLKSASSGAFVASVFFSEVRFYLICALLSDSVFSFTRSYVFMYRRFDGVGSGNHFTKHLLDFFSQPCPVNIDTK